MNSEIGQVSIDRAVGIVRIDLKLRTCRGATSTIQLLQEVASESGKAPEPHLEEDSPGLVPIESDRNERCQKL